MAPRCKRGLIRITTEREVTVTQPVTLQASKTATQMATALALVDVVRIGDLMEARHRETGQLLGTAVRSSHPQSDWIGWLIQCGSYRHEILISPAVGSAHRTVLADLVHELVRRTPTVEPRPRQRPGPPRREESQVPNGATHPTAWSMEEVLDKIRSRQRREQLPPIIHLNCSTQSPRILVRVAGFVDVLRWTAAMHKPAQPERYMDPVESLVAYRVEIPDVFGSGWLLEIVARVKMPAVPPLDGELLAAAEEAAVTHADAGRVVAGAVLALSGTVKP